MIPTNKKRQYQKDYWLKKAWLYQIPTEGREDESAREAERRYRKEYRARKKVKAECPP